MTPETWEVRLNEILVGIDTDETSDPDGWWETSRGVNFGTQKLQEVKDFIRSTIRSEVKKALEGVSVKRLSTTEYHPYNAALDAVEEAKKGVLSKYG